MTVLIPGKVCATCSFCSLIDLTKPLCAKLSMQAYYCCWQRVYLAYSKGISVHGDLSCYGMHSILCPGVLSES